MKKIKFLALILLSVILLTSCDFSPTAGHGTPKEDFPLFSIVMVGTVGGEGIGVVGRTEEDEYGRILFQFSIGNLMNSYFNGLRGYGICQKIDGEYAYYYDDFWYIGATQFEDISEDDIIRLKETNDWGKEIDESKPLSKVKSFSKAYETNLFDISEKEEESAMELFGELKNISDDKLENYDISYSCRDSSGKTLFYIATGEDRYAEEAYKTSKMYAIIVDENGVAEEKSILDIEDPYNCAAEVSAFKIANGWKPYE